MKTFSSHDRRILRDVAKEVAEIAALPVMAERRRRWAAHNALRSTDPMMLVFPEGAWTELITESDLKCEDTAAREIERALRQRIYTFRHFHDDSVVEAEWVVTAGPSGEVPNTGWGLEPVKVPSSEQRGAFRIEPVLRERSDLKKLRFPELLYDPSDHQSTLEAAHDLFGDILTVKRKGVAVISYHLWSQYIYLRGESAYMTDLIDAPDFVHEVMSFFEEGHRRMLQQMIDLNLLSLNNDHTYHSSGGCGYTDELPKAGFDPERVRPCDMWASAESQELAGVSPRMHRQFALEYERRLLAPFGLLGYGCCEDLSRKLDDVCAVPNMRRISISPFADVVRSAEKLQGQFIFSWKPQPAHLVGDFNEDLIRAYIRRTLEVCKANHCVLEIILKDTHTCANQPERFDRWTAVARSEIERISE
ncbi:MAG: hypothetical protein GX491_22830 [Chloroflexi bacterium]|nr:hypothetical protein [Chloroflexota bacterium]